MSMLASPTLARLISNVRAMLNQPNSANSTWTDQMLTEWLNEAVRMYFAEVVKNGEGQFHTSTTLDIATDGETIALPSDFFEIRALYIQRNSGWEILTYQNNVTSGFFTNSGTGGLTYTPYYYFRGNSIVLHPVPNFTQAAALRLDYVQFPDTMVNGGDSLTNQVSPIFRSLIEMYAVYKAKLQESMATGVSMHSVPAENLSSIAALFRDTINKRSMYPEFTVPFEPEDYY